MQDYRRWLRDQKVTAPLHFVIDFLRRTGKKPTLFFDAIYGGKLI